MSSSTRPDAADTEWALQERALEEERNKMAAGQAVLVNRYRLISRVLSEPLLERLPHDFTATVVAAAACTTERYSGISWRQLAALISVGAAYLAAMAGAAFLMHMDLTPVRAAFDWSTILMALSVVLSQGVGRVAALIGLVRHPLGTQGQSRVSTS